MSYRENMDLQMEIQPITQTERNDIKEAVKAAYFPDGEWASLSSRLSLFCLNFLQSFKIAIFYPLPTHEYARIIKDTSPANSSLQRDR